MSEGASAMIAYIGAGAALFNIIVTMVGGLIFIVRLEGKINVQSIHIAALQKTGELAQTFVTAMALVNKDVSHLKDTVEDLRRGRGWIQHPKNRDSVDGEYGS